MNDPGLVGERPTIADLAMYTYVAHAPEGTAVGHSAWGDGSPRQRWRPGRYPLPSNSRTAVTAATTPTMSVRMPVITAWRYR